MVLQTTTTQVGFYPLFAYEDRLQNSHRDRGFLPTYDNEFSTMEEEQSIVCVPMKIEAYRLNEASADGPSRLAPLSQPDFTRLRLNQRLSHNVLGDVDLHNTGHKFSSRVTNLATGEPRRERFGMYLHWILPRFYRTGLAATESSAEKLKDLRSKHGLPEPDDTDATPDPNSPVYRPVPPRWIIVRHLTSKTPVNANIPTFQAFVVESDRLSEIGDFDANVDIAVEASPYVYMTPTSTIADQAEMYIGYKQNWDDWEEDSSVTRVPLSILSNVNPVFTDYQPHNINVFSILDNFAYEDNGTKYLKQATANYYVMGWHPDPEDDPFCPPQGASLSHADRLEGCYMKLTETQSDEADNWLRAPLDEENITKVLIHGALYQVEWDEGAKPPAVPADNIANDYNSFSPVSVGVNPVDALLAVTHARALSYDAKHGDEPKANPLAQDILSLQTLVIKQDEDPDTQLQAADILFASYFVPASGGQHWHVAGATTSDSLDLPTDDEERKDLSQVNTKQNAIDLCLRQAEWIRWQVWAEWWKWVQSNVEHTDEDKRTVRDKVNALVNRHDSLIQPAAGWNQEIKEIAKQYNWETSAQPRFYTCRDPTVLLCGIKSGWPTDWSDLLKVRLKEHIVKIDKMFDSSPEGWDELETFASSLSEKLPGALQKTGELLLQEFFVLQPFASDTPHLRQPPPTDLYFPLYHDLDNSEATVWRDRWNGKQPWFPLFVEWEIEYYHIDHGLWSPAPRGAYGPPKLYFEVDGDISDITNSRRISGRSLALPHSNTMLKNTVEKLLKNKNSEKDIAALKTAIDGLDLLTLTLSSISGQLATKQQYTHLKPTMNKPGLGPRPLQEAVDASKGVIDENTIRLMHNTTMTPYADFPNFQDAEYSPFKPVLHGQFRFTRLNVIDKFGQAICAVDPNRGTEPKLHPYISEFYSCTIDNSSGQPVVRSAIPDDAAQCVQLEPRINQESRLNGHYLLWGDRGWRPVTEYENPIWGWLVVNYVDNGLQVFLPDGTFYREIRMGGPDGTSVGFDNWLPFKAPDGPDGDPVVPEQLRALVKKLRQANYLQEFFDVMVGALDATMFTPNQYAGYLPAITGKPFALVNSGWSLQLSHPPDVNHSTSTSPSSKPEVPIGSYNFQVKLGDKDRTFDGLLGYFNFKEKPEGSPEKTSLDFGLDFDLDNFYTYFPGPGHDASMTVVIEENNYPTFQAFYNDPLKDDLNPKNSEQIDLEYNRKLKVFGMLVDPFTRVHAYTGFLPVVTLHLPGWALEQGLKNITAFFHLGPMLMPNDVPPYDPDRVLKAGSDLKNIPDPPQKTSPFPIPAIGTADWAWLQPYDIEPVSVENINFNPFKLTPVPNEPKLESTPYTAVEGYLYLKKPITDPTGSTHSGQ
ncbi:hypothetical protein APHAL10511_008202 [Amanita phalloides]|nr:hypothetical protein APHAL10511_008202 [Amanita phalloides]